MNLFGKRRAVPPHHLDAIVALWLEGRLAASGGGPLTGRAAESAAYASRVDDALALADVRDPRALPRHMIANLNAVRAAVFAPSPEFELALQMIGAKQRDVLRAIRAGAEQQRRHVPSPPENSGSTGGKADLVAELGGDSPEEQRRRLLRWLPLQEPDPALWHEIALNSEPDGMGEVFLWIVHQPDCDAATAAFLFHACNAFEALEWPGVGHDTTVPVEFRVARTVARRWQSGEFRTNRFSFPERGYELSWSDYAERAAAARAKFGRAAFDVPPGLFEFHDGEGAETGWVYRGL